MDDAGLSASAIVEVNEPEAFSWIAGALRGPVGEQPRGDHLRTADLLPPVFESYAKILHPVFRLDPARDPGDGVAHWEEPRGTRVRWSEVARTAGVTFDAALPDSIRDSWPRGLSLEYEGGLTPGMLGALIRRLDPERATVANFWWWVVVAFGFHPSREPVADVLCRGPLSALAEFLDREHRPSPTYWWPSDRAWCVATDWDLCFTMVGGSASLIRRLLGDPDIEGFEVDPDSVLLHYSKLRPAQG